MNWLLKSSISNLRRILATLAKTARPPERLKISEWAERYAHVPPEGNSEPGKYRLSRVPYQRDMLDDPLDPTVTEHIWWIASQLGKTLCLVIITEYFIDHQPTAILAVYPTLDSAKSWMRDKFIPATKATPRLKGKLKEPRERDSESTTLNRKFAGGNLTACGAISTSTLRQRSKRVVLQDEIDDYEDTDQGDPVDLADKRADTFHNAVKIKSSTGKNKGLSRIEFRYGKSDQQKYFCPCPRCNHPQVLNFWQIKWEKAKLPDGSHQHLTEGAWYECESCHEKLLDSDRVRMIERGQWLATKPGRKIRGRWLNGVYQLLGKKDAYANFLHQFAEEFLKAKEKGGPSYQVWVNTFLNETWEEQVERVDTTPLVNRAEDYTPQTLPDEIVLAVAAVDVQKAWFQWEVIGIGLDEETWGIETGKVEGDPEQDEVWSDLADVLASKYKRIDGVEIPITATAIDMRHKPMRVKRFVLSCGIPRVYAVYGVGTGRQNVLVTTNKRARPHSHAIDTNMAKDTIFARLEMDKPGPRYMHFPRGHGYNEEYFEQLTAEVLRTKLRRGYTEQHYEKIRERNEALDIRVYQLACLDILKPRLTEIAKRLQRPAGALARDYILKPPALPVEPVSAPQVAVRQRHRIQVGRWR